MDHCDVSPHLIARLMGKILIEYEVEVDVEVLVGRGWSNEKLGQNAGVLRRAGLDKRTW